MFGINPGWVVVAHSVPPKPSGEMEVQPVEEFFEALGEAITHNTHVQMIVSGFDIFEEEMFGLIKDFLDETTATIICRSNNLLVVKSGAGFNVVIHCLEITKFIMSE